MQQLKQYPQLAEQLPQSDSLRHIMNEAEETDYRRPSAFTRPDPSRPPGFGVEYLKSKNKDDAQYSSPRPSPRPHWSQTTSTTDASQYSSTSGFRRPQPGGESETDEALPHGARPRFYQKPFRPSEEDVLFTR